MKWLARLWRNKKFRVALFIGALAALGTNLPALQPYIAPPVYAALVLVVEVMRSLLMVVNIFIGGSPL